MTTTRREELTGLLSNIQAQPDGFKDAEARNAAFAAATGRFAAISDAVTKLSASIALEPAGPVRDHLNDALTRAQALKDREQSELDAATAANAGYADALARHTALVQTVVSIKSALALEPRSVPRHIVPGTFTHGSP